VSPRPVHLVLLGPPGSGKGTQAARLSLALRIPAISTGDILRAQQQADSTHGGQLRHYLDHGELVPDSLVIDIIRHRLGDPDTVNGFILDGFPRTGAQGEALDSMLDALQRPIDAAVYLAIPPATLIDRLSHRYVCPRCGAVSSPAAIPPGTTPTCPVDGSALTQRSDDRPEVVRHRIEVYLVQTAPLTEYYRRGHRLVEVDSDRSPELVYQSIRAGLAGLRGQPGGDEDAAVVTPRLRLVLLTAQAIRDLLAGDRQTAERLVRLPIPAAFGGDQDRSFLEVQLQRIQQLPEGRGWMVRLIVLRQPPTVIGSIGFHGPPALVGRAEMGYSVFPPWRRQGYAIEAVRALLEWAAQQGTRSVFLSIGPNNAASLAMARRLGFHQVGVQEDEIDGTELVFELPPVGESPE